MLKPCSLALGVVVDTVDGTLFGIRRGQLYRLPIYESRGNLMAQLPNGKQISYARAVAVACLKPVEGKVYVGFKDGDKHNVAPTNLYWRSMSEITAKPGHLEPAKYQKEIVRDLYRYVKFSDGKQHWVPRHIAVELMQLPVSERIYDKHKHYLSVNIMKQLASEGKI